MANVRTKNCRSCDSVISHHAKLCPHCGSTQRFSLGQSLGHSIPLIAATVSTLLLVGTLIWPSVFPERARIVVQTASPAYALNELRLDIANLSDLAVLLPSEMHCSFTGEREFMLQRFGTVSVDPSGRAYSVLTLQRTEDSAVGLRNQSARVKYAVDTDEKWGASGVRGRLDCLLRLEDRHAELDPIKPLVVFEINDGGIILYDIGDFHDAENMEISAGLFFAPRNELLPDTAVQQD